MKDIKKIFFCFVIIFFVSSQIISASQFFSGYAGVKLKVCAEEITTIENDDSETVKNFRPSLSLQSFFASQLDFTQNIWGHLAFSLDTDNMLTESIFKKTTLAFKINEISVTFKQPFEAINNYISVFAGTCDPIGSDLFLQRQFGISPISSKLTESWMGSSGSLLYPNSGIGAADVIQFSSPMATGIYIYINPEDANYFVFNIDMRYAFSFRFFTLDFAIGVGAPYKYNNNSSVDSFLWHAGTTLLIGNNITNSLFIQAGIYNAALNLQKEKNIINPENIFLLVEPRFKTENVQFHLTFYSVPEKSLEDLTFMHDTLGINLNIFSDNINTQNRNFCFGMHTTVSFPNKTFYDLSKPLDLFSPGNVNFILTPYFKTKILKGEFNAILELSILDFEKAWQKAFTFSVGYKTSF